MIKKQLANAIGNKVNEVNRSNFIEEVRRGRKVSLNTLHKLKSIY